MKKTAYLSKGTTEANQTAKRSMTSQDLSQVSETILWYHHVNSGGARVATTGAFGPEEPFHSS